jgi:hypothetical protein
MTRPTRYFHYQFPRYDLPSFPNVTIFNWSTTGVEKGGEARGLLKVSSAGLRNARQLDSIDYLDPNVPCGQHGLAKWYVLKVGGMTGWYVTKRSDGETQGRTAGC